MESDEKYILLSHSSSNRSIFSIPKGSSKASVFTLCSSIIGAGILTYPYIMSRCGILIGILMMLFGGVFFTVYYSLLVYACDKMKVYDYVQLVSIVLGQVTFIQNVKKITEVSIVVMCFGAVSAFMILIVDFLYSLLVSFDVLEAQYNFYIGTGLKFLLIIFVWFPLCLPRELTALRYCSMLSVAGMCYILIVLALQSPDYIHISSFTYINYADTSKIFYTFGVAFWAYDGGQNIPIIYSELTNKSRYKMMSVIIKSMCILSSIYCALGLIGYLSTIQNTPTLIIFRQPLDESSDWAMIIGRAIVCIYLNMAIPMNLYPTRLTLEQIIWGENKKKNTQIHVGITLAILITSAVMTIFVPNIVVYIEMLGSLCAVPLCIVLPGCLYIKLSRNRVGRMCVIAGMTLCVLLGIGCIIDSVKSIV